MESPAIAYDPVSDTFKVSTTVGGGPTAQDLQKVSGTAQTARDWSGDLAKLQSIPTDPAKESGKLTNIDTSIGNLTKVATPFYVQATASGNNTIITPTGGKKIRIKAIMVLNSGAANITVYLRFAAGGTARFQGTLAANSGWNFNLIGCHWEGAVNELFIANLSGTGTVDVSGMYEEI